MSKGQLSENDHIRVPVNARRTAWRVSRGILGSALLVFSALAPAENAGGNRPDSVVIPWSLLSSPPYLPDPGFWGGLYKPDGFTPSYVDDSFFGRKVVRLGNGDVIVAGVVPDSYSTSPGAPVINLGLVRYNATGGKVAWTNPGAYGYNGYVIFPNTTDPADDRNVKDVLDMKVLGERVFVLVDSRYHGSNADIDSHILVFGIDGAFLGSTNVLSSSKPEYSGGMLIYEDSSGPGAIIALVVASTFDSVWRPTLIKGTVNSNSSISFSPPVFPNPSNYCPTNRGCILRSIARRADSGFLGPYYLAGTRQSSIPDTGGWDFLVMAVNSLGNPFSNFGNNGVTTVAFDSGGNGYDDANSIEFGRNSQTYADEIYVTGFVNRTCKDGVGVVKMNYNGVLDTSFGSENSGKIIIGGSNLIPGFSCAQLDIIPATHASDAALSLNFEKLAIAGYSATSHSCAIGQTCPEDDVNGMIAVIDTANGHVDTFRSYPYTDVVNGPRTRHSGFWGITDSGNGTFTATGDARFFQTAAGQPPGASKFATLRVRSDGIFASGFGSGDDH
ncbi:MAG: hypothetical protein ABI127_01805 [Dokdonella sp.]